jgi:hypothetical protein
MIDAMDVEPAVKPMTEASFQKAISEEKRINARRLGLFTAIGPALSSRCTSSPSSSRRSVRIAGGSGGEREG